ncbi:MAG TPA: hypothetical protein VMC62_05475 [Longilinea sp.]|nr:hypothetical protein [Longilinea sp.]
MAENPTQSPVQISPDDKTTPVMAYTQNSIIWGDVVTKQQIRVSSWLKTSAAPDVVAIYNAKVLPVLFNGEIKPSVYSEAHVPTKGILAFHILPPAADPLDYDPNNEPNLHMEPVSVLAANIRMDGFLRLSIRTNLAKFIDVSHETFTNLYDVVITSPIMPALGSLKCSLAIVRADAVTFCTRTV